MKVPNKLAINLTVINPFFNDIDKLPFQLVQSKVVKLLLDLFEDSVPFFGQVINDRVKDFLNVLFNRLKRVRIGQNSFFEIADAQLETQFMWGATVAVLIFAKKGFLSAVLTEASDRSLVAFGAFGEVD
jgi:hypothetical protein